MRSLVIIFSQTFFRECAPVKELRKLVQIWWRYNENLVYHFCRSRCIILWQSFSVPACICANAVCIYQMLQYVSHVVPSFTPSINKVLMCCWNTHHSSCLSSSLPCIRTQEVAITTSDLSYYTYPWRPWRDGQAELTQLALTTSDLSYLWKKADLCSVS